MFQSKSRKPRHWTQNNKLLLAIAIIGVIVVLLNITYITLFGSGFAFRHTLPIHSAINTHTSSSSSSFSSSYNYNYLPSFHLTRNNPNRGKSLAQFSLSEQLSNVNKQMMCPIYEHHTGQKYLLDLIYKHQYTNTFNKFNKYLIFDFEKVAHFGGLGYLMYDWFSVMFAMSLKLNRTFLVRGQFEMISTQSYCQGFEGLECLFEPLSLNKDINVNELLHDKDATIKSSTPYKIWQLCIEGDVIDKTTNDNYCNKFDIIYINKRNRSEHFITFKEMSLESLNIWMYPEYNIAHYQMILISYIMRLKPNVKKIILNKLETNFDFLNRYEIQSNQIVSLPIRASDKCGNAMFEKYWIQSKDQIENDPKLHDLIDILNPNGKNSKKNSKTSSSSQSSSSKNDFNYLHAREIDDCWTPLELYKMLETLRDLSNNVIDTVVITSEDIVVKRIIKSYLESNKETNWHVIENSNDYTSGAGVGWVNKFNSKNNLNSDKNINSSEKIKNFVISDNLGSSLETDGVVGGLSSLYLQINSKSKYTVYYYYSHWLRLIWYLKYFLNCGEYDIFYDNNNGIFPNKYQCVELLQKDGKHPKIRQKHIKLPYDMWLKIHADGIHPKKFYSDYGINILTPGWEQECISPKK